MINGETGTMYLNYYIVNQNYTNMNFIYNNFLS